MAVVCEGVRERIYLNPTEEIELVAKQVKPLWKPEFNLIGKSVDQLPLYGMKQYWQLFTPRQLTALTNFSDLVKEAREKVLKDAKKANILPDDDRPLNDGGTCPQAYADAVATYLAFALNGTGAVW